MSKRWFLALLALLIAVSFTVVACGEEATPAPAPAPGAAPAPAAPAPAPAPKVIKWRMATSWPAGLAVLQEGAVNLAETITEASGGRLEIEVFPAGALVGPLELFDATSKGTIEMGQGAAGYQVGKFPAAAFFSAIPFSVGLEGYVTWLYEAGGLELWNEMYAGHNVVAFPAFQISPEMAGWYNIRIDSPDDYKGMKIRFFGLGGDAIAKLGASVVLMGGGELYLALDRGVIDATEFSMPAIDEGLGLHEVAKYYVYPGWHQQTSAPELLINKDAWDALPADLQAIVEMATKANIVYGITVGEWKSAKSLDTLKAKGVTLVELNPETLNVIRKAVREVMDEQSAKDPFFAKVRQSWEDFMAVYAPWYEISRLKKELVGY